MTLTKLFDGYAWKARLLVAALVALPVLIVIPWTTNAIGFQVNPWLLNPVVQAAVIILGSLVVRQLGVTAEVAMKKEWGDFPSTLIMRESNPQKSSVWKARMRKLVKQKLGLTLCSPQEEVENPGEADRRIRDAFDKIRTRIWGKKNLPTHTANTDYGFARNLYGCRWIWIVLSLTCSVVVAVIAIEKHLQLPWFEIVACIFMAMIIPWLEWKLVKPHTKHCAYRYAEYAWEHLEKMS